MRATRTGAKTAIAAAPPGVAAVRLWLAQQPRLRSVDGSDVELSPADALLLVLLAVDGPQSRTRLAEWLSPAVDEPTARNRLRQRLFQLRQASGHALIEGRATLALAAGVTHDLGDAATLLGTLDFAQHPDFEPWLQAERQRRAQRHREALAGRIEALEASGQYAAALPVAESLLREDPLSEDAHRRLIRLHYLRGDRAAALLAFDRCAEVLKHEVGGTPSAQTLQLLDSLQRLDAPARVSAGGVLPASVIRPPRMVGREDVRRRIRRDLDGGAVAVVVGEAGMGKSRMLAELAQDARRVVGAAARPGDTGVPFASMARLLRTLHQASPDSLSDELRQAVACLVPELAPAALPARVDAAHSLERALQRWVEGAARTVDLLAFDDLHFADAASLDMLQALAARAAPTAPRWVLALRPAEAGSRAQALLDALAESGRLALAPLEPLSASDLAELVDQLGLPQLDGAALGATLHRQSGGNPLFALETLKQLWLDGASWPPAAGAALPRPAGVMTLIERRLARLSATALAVARVAAVAGIDHSVELAEHVLEQPALLLADAWTELAQAQVLRDGAFAHDLVFEAVGRGIPAPIARRTHARVAAFLADHAGEPARIADHWLQAARAAEALPWLQAAAAQAGRALRSREQCEFLQRAADVAESLGQRAQAFDLVFEAAELTGRAGLYALQPDTRMAERLRALADTPLQQAQAGMALTRQLHVLHRHEEAVREGARAMQLARDGGATRLAHEIATYHGSALLYAGRPDEAVVLLQGEEDWVEQQGDATQRMDFHGNLGAVLDMLGRAHEALPHHRQAIALARELGLWGLAADSLGNVAVGCTIVGDIDAALQALHESERLFSVYEGLEAEPFGAMSFAVCHRIRGRYADALRAADAAVQHVQPVASPTLTANAHLKRVEIWLELAQFARAQRELDEIDALGELPFSQGGQALLLRTRLLRWQGHGGDEPLARALAALPAKGRPDLRHRLWLEQCVGLPPLQVWALTERVLEEAVPLGHQGTVLAAWVRRCGALQPDDAAFALDAAARTLARAASAESMALYRPEVWLASARALRAGGDLAGARRQIDKAQAWIAARVQEGQVPDAFVDSFLQRNPVNREIAALAVALRTARAA